MFLFFVALLCSVIANVNALDSAGWRTQSIYQVMVDRFARTDGSTTASCSLGEYCGGTWQGLINKLDYIQGMGFTAVWISPIVKNVEGSTIDGDSYHGYWAQKINSLNDRFGTPDDLQRLATALHNRGMYLMVDVVTNHMAYKGCGNCVDYSTFDVFDSQDYYHPFCLISNYDDPLNTQTCWAGSNTVSLPDLRTEDSNVRSMWNIWVKDIVAKYAIDGLRIDSCTSVEQSFYDDFVESSGVYAICEAFHGNPDVVCPYQEHVPGMMNYPAYFWILRAFQSTTGDIAALANGVNWMKSRCADTTLLGSFIENHDNPRFPSYTSDMALTRNAIAFTMLADGMPIIYQGQEQHYSGALTPTNREPVWTSGYSTTSPLYTFIATLNAIKNWAIFKDAGFATYKADVVYSDSNIIATRKGSNGYQVIGVTNNLGLSASRTFSLPGTGYAAGTSVTDILTCEIFTVGSDGNIAVTLDGGAPRVFYPSSSLSGSGLCSSSTPVTPQTDIPTTTLATSPCAAAPTSVAVTFNELVATNYGDSIKVVGSIPELGSWSVANAIALNAGLYTAASPLWATTVNLRPGQSFEYKHILVASDGSVTWESNPNRVYSVPSSCATTATIDDTWR